MKNDYLIVDKKILPDNYNAVIEARNLIENSKISVSDACLKVGISRCTFYKYKDYVFIPQRDLGKKAIITMRLENRKGILSAVLNSLSDYGCNILTINQTAPVNNIAFVTLSVDVIDLKDSVEEMLKETIKLDGVISNELISIE